MPSSKNVLQSNEDLDLDKYELTSEHSKFCDHFDATDQYDNHVLKEKVNNNGESTYGCWHYDTFNNAAIKGLNTNISERHEYKILKYYDEKTKCTYTPKDNGKISHDQSEYSKNISCHSNNDTPISQPSNLKTDENVQHSVRLQISPENYTGK